MSVKFDGRARTNGVGARVSETISKRIIHRFFDA